MSSTSPLSVTTSKATASGTALIRSAADVSDLVNSGTARSRHAKMIVVIALGGIFLDAYDLSSLAYGLPDITAQFGLSSTMAGTVTASISVGSLLGALVGGWLVDRIGRYRVFMANMLFFVVTALVCAVAQDVWTLIGARFVMGIGVGMDIPVAIAFLAEFSRLRGKGSKGSRTAAWSPAWYTATSGCYLVIMVLYFLLPHAQLGWLWRFTVGFGAIPALLVLVLRRRYMNESPTWAAEQGDLEGAARILRASYGVDARVADDARVPAARPHRPGLASYARLFTPPYRTRTLQSVAVGIAETFGYNAVAFGLPIIIATLMTQGPLTTIASSFALNLVFALTGGLLGIRWASTRGAWPMMSLGFAIQLVAITALACIGRPSGTAVVTAGILMLGAFMFAQGFGPGAHIMSYASLGFPTSMRGVSIGFNQAVLRLGSTLTLFFFPVLSSGLGTGVYWVILAAPVLGLTALLVKRWEPIGFDADAEERARREAAG
ncbi:MFS transporter [Streptomyces sp. SID14478]|uniref:MFS transporter n=1 Tax=Streptomyces sp. SID14478 TaxID=2706073 RepID=UPI0013D92783|nr:MFS transporter [Streptomyces sp. SID14478]NEB74117.1 MFS transporter [Streptomyces sp. SID14478]